MTSEEFRSIVLSFPETEEAPHFERIAFRVRGRRIFATLHAETASANLKLTPDEQQSFSEADQAISPIPNKWGLQGWTTFTLSHLSEDIVLAALESAYADVLRKTGKKR